MMRNGLSLMVVAFLFLGFSQAVGQDEGGLTLKDIWRSGKYRAQSVYGLRSMNDGIHYTSLETREGVQKLVKYSFKSGKEVDVLIDGSKLIPEGSEKPIRIESYSFSADEQKVLIATEVERIYRYSTRENNYVYELQSQKLTKLFDKAKQRYATFSPAGDKVAFVSQNNLFVSDLGSGESKQVTFDGKEGSIIYGATDWVYEEEFGFDKAFFWSPDGKRIAYYRFDESAVREFNMPMYGQLYPQDNRFKYPKAGEANSEVMVLAYDVENNVPIEISSEEDDLEYIPRVKWTANPEVLAIFLMNRHQSDFRIQYVHAPTGESRTVYQEKSETYIDIHDNFTFINGESAFLFTSERNGFNHVYLNDMAGKGVVQITTGDWDVTELIGYDEAKGVIYFMSAEDSPLERHLYKINWDGTGKTKITTRKGTNRVVFSKGYKFFINYHTDANSPTYVSLHEAEGKEIRVLKDNNELRKRLKGLNMSPKEFFSFTTSEGHELNGWMIKPPNFNKKKKYPVLMYVYGGPGSQTVNDSWGGNYLWHQYMASKGYIIVSVDNRGTGSRGRNFKHVTYKQLGKYETIDQIEAARYLKKQEYVNPDRIGIWGWSYGGYMSSLCITKGADDFKAAVAVAPVSNWRYYDSIYTERYMQTPQENADGYDDNSPINHVDKLKGAYLLVHGTADDNVHFQNAVEMVNALIRADKQFDFYMYPDCNHGIYGGNTRYHLFTKISNFIEQNL